MTRTTPYRTSPSNPAIGEIQTQPDRIKDMPYAPAMRVTAGTDLLFISGATASPLYHKHPHAFEEHDHPNDIKAQVRLVMANIQEILDKEGLKWTDIVKITRYFTDMRDFEAVMSVMPEYFGNWSPASTAICVNQLSSPGARLELDMIAAYPK